MTFSKQTRLATLFIATLIVGACTADTSLRTRVESYVANNITELSPRTATQGEFRVTDVEWVEDNIVLITYEDDAGVELRATASVDETNADLVTNFRIDTTRSRSSSSSDSSMSSDMSDVSDSSESSSDMSSASTMSDSPVF